MKPINRDLPALLLMTTSPLTRAFFKRADAKLPHTTLTFSDSLVDALDLLNKILIAYVVIDQNVPHLDLAKTCIKIRQIKGHECTPILIITSQLKKSFMHHLLKAGATDFLIEPLEEEELFYCMEQAKSVKQTQKKLSKLSSAFAPETAQKSSMRERTILDNYAVKLVSEMLRENDRLALLLLEVDHYNLIEHEQDASITNELCTSVEMHLRKVIRKQDLLFSEKKGKFLILLPQTTSKAALFIAENVQESIKTDRFQIGEQKFEVSVSVGLVGLDEKTPKKKNIGALFDYLMEKAKICLEEAKKKKDNIVVYHAKKGLFVLCFLLIKATSLAGAAPSPPISSGAKSLEELDKRGMEKFLTDEKKGLVQAQRDRSDIMIIDPKTRAQDLREVFEYLRKKSPSSRLSVKLANHTTVQDILDMTLMSNGTMIVFRVQSPQGQKFEVVKIEEIETITNSYGNDASYLFKKLPHPRAAPFGRSTSPDD